MIFDNVDTDIVGTDAFYVILAKASTLIKQTQENAALGWGIGLTHRLNQDSLYKTAIKKNYTYDLGAFERNTAYAFNQSPNH